MGRKLTIPYYRPTFVQKELSEVGDETDFPMEATLDQIAEVYYRVKDAVFTDGLASIATGDPELEPAFSAQLIAPTSAPSNRISYDGYVERGYSTRVEIDMVTIDPLNESFLGEEYDAGSGLMCRDVADDELGTFTTSVLPDWNSVGTGFVTAFSFGQETGGDIGASNPQDVFWISLTEDQEPPIYLRDANANVIFSGLVGVVKVSPTSDMLDPANRFFIGLEFIVFDDDFGGSIFQISTNAGSLSGSGTEICNYIIRLSSGDIECPVYFYTDDGDYPFSYGDDFIHEATEWWPYDDGNGNPVWNTATGAKL